jgi:uncharacterized membrane protein YkoI
MNHSTTPRLIAALAVLFACTAAQADTPDPALQAQAKITEAAASQTAMTKAPGGKILSSELEVEHGKLLWSFDIKRPGMRKITEVQVDAKTGKILATEFESPKQQAAEAVAERKEAKKH